MQIKNVHAIFPTETYTGNSRTLVSIIESATTSIKPISPPIMQRNAASSKNSVRMMRLLAPTAFFKPICGVRSLTVTNMILATPNKPTIRLIPPITAPPMFKPTNASDTCPLISSILFSAKLDSLVGLSLRTLRIMPSSSSLSADMLTPSFPFTIITGSVLNSL